MESIWESGSITLVELFYFDKLRNKKKCSEFVIYSSVGDDSASRYKIIKGTSVPHWDFLHF